MMASSEPVTPTSPISPSSAAALAADAPVTDYYTIAIMAESPVDSKFDLANNIFSVLCFVVPGFVCLIFR